MASDTLERYKATAGLTPGADILADMMDDDTELAGSNREQNEGQEEEILVKWQMPGTLDLPAAKRQLISLLATLMMAYPERITIIDRKQQEWVYTESSPEEQFVNSVESMIIRLHPVKTKQQQVNRWVSIIKLRTSTTIQEWKNNDDFYDQARAAKIYVFPHPFGYDEWEVASIGFLKSFHVVHYPREILHAKLTKMLEEQDSDPPVFQLIPQRISTNDNKASTKAYTIQCEKSSTAKLIHMFTHGRFRQTAHQVFVPFKYKRSQPDIFLQCIRQQNEVYHKTWIIKLEGITQEAMAYIGPEIGKIKGVFHVVPSKRASNIGEWKVLVDQSRCSFIHRTLVKNWHDLIAIIPGGIKDNAPAEFPSPTVSSRKVRDYQDDSSEADSYGSLLTAGTDTSQMTSEDAFLDELPMTYQYPSYAAVARATESNSSTGSTQISSPTTSAATEWQKEKQELDRQLQQQAKLIEQIQAELQEKISRSQDLEEKLAQALELADLRDQRHEEMMNKFEMLMTLHQSNATPISSALTLPRTPIRTNTKSASPPSKRKNMNSTPHRGVYSIFRSAPGSNQSENEANMISAASEETQMDTDDAYTKPPPGAEPGQPKE
jgi:hypothetical protein